MYDLTHDIVINDRFRVKHLLGCEVRKRAGQLADTATLHLSGMAYNAALEIESKVKRGHPVTIAFGYDGKNVPEFSGYVRSVGTGETVTLECEDEMFNLRKPVGNKQYADLTAVDLIKAVVSQVGVTSVAAGDGAADVAFAKFTVKDATAFEVLSKIKQETGLHIFFVEKELHVHLKYEYDAGAVRYDFSRNVEKSDLTYVKEEEKIVQVEVVGIRKDHTKGTVMEGETGGDKITEYRYRVTEEKALKRIAKEVLKEYRFTGYEGSLTTWLLPNVSCGASARIVDELYPHREGIYYVEAVTTTFDERGGRRKVALGIRLLEKEQG